jgi:hypothetical protein
MKVDVIAQRVQERHLRVVGVSFGNAAIDAERSPDSLELGVTGH